MFPTDIRDTYFSIQLDTLKYEKFKLGEFKYDISAQDYLKGIYFKPREYNWNFSNWYKTDLMDLSKWNYATAPPSYVRRKNALSTYTINDGGVRITVSSSYGNIFIKKRM
ncbi:hypothetical protein AMJ80_02790 [bacterium SM23_31]|nr:MAG: hypothetical protein AMJ80_02790 [bacterium SM23_31]